MSAEPTHEFISLEFRSQNYPGCSLYFRPPGGSSVTVYSSAEDAAFPRCYFYPTGLPTSPALLRSDWPDCCFKAKLHVNSLQSHAECVVSVTMTTLTKPGIISSFNFILLVLFGGISMIILIWLWICSTFYPQAIRLLNQVMPLSLPIITDCKNDVTLH